MRVAAVPVPVVEGVMLVGETEPVVLKGLVEVKDLHITVLATDRKKKRNRGRLT